jgi:hypothetical protein
VLLICNLLIEMSHLEDAFWAKSSYHVTSISIFGQSWTCGEWLNKFMDPRNAFWELMYLSDTFLQVDGPPVYFTLTIMMTHALYIYLWWSGCQPKVKKHKVRTRGRMLVLISTSWPKGWANWALDSAPWSKGAHPLGLRVPIAQHHIREVEATRNSTL